MRSEKSNEKKFCCFLNYLCSFYAVFMWKMIHIVAASAQSERLTQRKKESIRGTSQPYRALHCTTIMSTGTKICRVCSKKSPLRGEDNLV